MRRKRIVKSKSEVRNYILIFISWIVIASCYVAINLYGRDIRFLVLLAGALLALGLLTRNVLRNSIVQEYGSEKQYKIEMKDERNTIIREKAGSKTNEYMLYLGTVILFILIFIDVESWVIFLVGFFIFIQGILSIALYDYYASRN
jgi:hypothetical protein